MNRLTGVVIIGVGLVAALIVLHNVHGGIHWWTVPGYAVIGCALVLFEWGAERLWLHTLAGMIHRPLSFVTYLSRIPFWFFGGGIGYIIGMLVAKKFGLMGFYDVPVKPLFILGGIAGIVMQGVVWSLIYRSQKNHRPQGT